MGVVTPNTETQKDVVWDEHPKTNPVMVYGTVNWTPEQIICVIKAAGESGHTVENNGSFIKLSGQGDKVQFFTRMSELLKGDGQ